DAVELASRKEGCCDNARTRTCRGNYPVAAHAELVQAAWLHGRYTDPRRSLDLPRHSGTSRRLIPERSHHAVGWAQEDSPDEFLVALLSDDKSSDGSGWRRRRQKAKAFIRQKPDADSAAKVLIDVLETPPRAAFHRTPAICPNTPDRSLLR